MIRLAITAAIFLTGMFDLFLAVSFLGGPQQAAAGLGVAPITLGGADMVAAGLSTIRGDFTSFFGVAGFCMMWGAWRRNADLLLVPAMLFGVTLAGRALNLAVIGAYPGWWFPMAVEAAHVALALVAWRMLPHHRIEEIAA
jgi:hypothetical protein